MQFPKGKVYVRPAHEPNPDIYGGYWSEPPANKNSKVEVTSWKEASQLCLKYIEDGELGAGNWTGGQITSGKSRIALARVSYNGRVWEGDKYPSTEIKL